VAIGLVTEGFAWSHWWAIVFCTFASEDGTCIATALLIRDGKIGLLTGFMGCFIGIYLGDLLLWWFGYAFGRRALAIPAVARRLPRRRIEQMGAWINQRGWKAVLASRFLPGTRLPMYVAAGMLGARPGRFAVWTLLAVALWTPLVMWVAAVGGSGVTGPLRKLAGSGWLGVLAATIALLIGLRMIELTCTAGGRARLIAGVSRLWRWEFWPVWLFYLPVVPWVSLLALRYRGLTIPTAANPSIPHGGIVGESKFDILSRLPGEWVVPSKLLPPGDIDSRMQLLAEAVRNQGWSYPLILKPDFGERGAGVRMAHSGDEAREYLERNSGRVCAQVYHPGPFEAGIFYYRLPGEARGSVFSITDKHFPAVTGDGQSTVKELIWRHPRYRMQAGRFLARLNGQADRVLERDKCLRLAVAGNHCQGAMFRDGGHLLTDALEQAVDRIARQFPGFCFGRFDVRYGDVEAFRAGGGFSIVELNGATSESTNIYDPSWPLWRAYRVLFAQWSILFRIGAINRRLGAATTPVTTLARHVLACYRRRMVDPLSD